MPSLNPIPVFDLSQLDVVLTLDPVTRWEIYHRLRELAIPCQCQAHCPLAVTVETPMAIAQVWSVVQARVAPKADLVSHLKRCWQQRIIP